MTNIQPYPSCVETEDFLTWVYNTLYEINPSNYDHDEVCKLNNASVEVILAIKARREPKSPAQRLAEECPHGMTPEAAQWVLDRLEQERKGECSTIPNLTKPTTDTDYIAVPRDVLGAACYIIRKSEHAESKTAETLREYALATPTDTAPRYVFGPWVMYDEHPPKECIEIDVGHAPGTYRRAYRIGQSYTHDGGECPLADGSVVVFAEFNHGVEGNYTASKIHWRNVTSFTPLDEGSRQ